MTHKFEVRGTSIDRNVAITFKSKYPNDDWKEKLTEGFNFMLNESKEDRLDQRETFAFHKWLTEQVQ